MSDTKSRAKALQALADIDRDLIDDSKKKKRKKRTAEDIEADRQKLLGKLWEQG